MSSSSFPEMGNTLLPQKRFLHPAKYAIYSYYTRTAIGGIFFFIIYLAIVSGKVIASFVLRGFSSWRGKGWHRCVVFCEWI